MTIIVLQVNYVLYNVINEIIKYFTNYYFNICENLLLYKHIIQVISYIVYN